MLSTTRPTGSLPRLRVDARPAYEFILTLIAFVTPDRVDSYDVGPEWFERTGARVTEALRGRIERLTQGCEHLVCRLFGLAHDVDPPASADALIEAVDPLDPATLRLTLLGYYARRTRRRVPPELILAAAEGDTSAQRRLVADASDGPECERALSTTLATEPVALHTLVLEVLRGWRDAVWDMHLAEAWPVIEREADRLRAMSTHTPVDKLVSQATNGADILPAPGIDLVELYPTWVLRPWTIQWEHDSTLIIGVPVPPGQLSADPDEPPERLVQLSRALGDGRRLRVLRRLTTGDYSLQELSEYFDIPKTTLLHHLVILRSVGIVRVGPGANGRYSLRPGMPLELHRLLDGYLPAVRTDASRDGRRLS
jgi:DNA-binding transcriptional ArsR family regulator